jgi:hypothetical protein
MGILSSLINRAGDLLPTIKSFTLPIKLSNETLNKAAKYAFEDHDEIKSVTLTMHADWFDAHAHVHHNLAEFDVSVGFEIVRFEVGKHIQLIELRQKTEIETAAQGWRNQIAVYSIKMIISAFTGKSILQWGLKKTNGISFIDDLISVDLAQVRAKDALFVAMAEKIGEHAGFLSPLIQGGAEKLADFICIEGAECVEDALNIKVKLLPS